MHRQVLDARIQIHGTLSVVTASALSNLGTLLSMNGKIVEAEMAHSQAFRLRRKLLGESHPITIDSMINEAACLHNLGLERGGEMYLVEALKRRKMGLVEPPLIAAKSDQNLGYLLSCYGRRDEAVPFLRKALEVREERLGATHPYVLWTRDLLADLLIRLGVYTEGEQLLVQVLETRKQQFGIWHPNTLSSIERPLQSLSMANPVEADRLEANLVDALDKEPVDYSEDDDTEVDEAMSASWVQAFRAEFEVSKKIQEDKAGVVTLASQRDSFNDELRRLQPRYRQHSANFRTFSTFPEWGLSQAPLPRFPECDGCKVSANTSNRNTFEIGTLPIGSRF